VSVTGKRLSTPVISMESPSHMPINSPAKVFWYSSVAAPSLHAVRTTNSATSNSEMNWAPPSGPVAPTTRSIASSGRLRRGGGG
jgi:hypothetical protein